MLKSKFKAPLLLVGLLMAAGVAQAQNAAVVNGKPISSELLDFIVAEQAKRGAPASPEMRATIRQEMVKQEVLRQEAVKKGLGNSDSVKFQMQMINQAVLANALRENYFQTAKPSDAEIKESYDKIASMISGNEFRASHILVETEDEAKKIIADLNNGGDFAALAKANSKDPGSAQNGGDLDWANPQAFVPEFSKAMVDLKKGEYTKEPVKSDFGYHIILLTDMRESAAPPLEQIKDQLVEKMMADKWEQYQADLLKKAKIQ